MFEKEQRIFWMRPLEICATANTWIFQNSFVNIIFSKNWHSSKNTEKIILNIFLKNQEIEALIFEEILEELM